MTETTICELHRRIVALSQPGTGGIYSDLPRRIAGSSVVFPNPRKIPHLMERFATWLQTLPSVPSSMFEAHFRLTAIHPFSDGNGRMARLLVNLLLIRGGYPPMSIRPQDRKDYLGTLEHGSMTEDLEPFQTFIHARLDWTLGEYLDALGDALPEAKGEAGSRT